MLTPILRQSVSDAVFEQLRKRIVSGDIAPGTALPPERKLAETLKVNRQAVREALKRLEQARLVSVRHGGGTHVTDYLKTGGLDLLTDLLLLADGNLHVTAARSIIEFRTALAPDIARRAAQRATPQIVERMQGRVDAMKKADGDLAAVQRLAMDFWGDAVEGSGNLAYRLAYNTLDRLYRRIIELLTGALAEELQDIRAYQRIVNAIAYGNIDRAESETRRLVRKGEAGLTALLDTLQGNEP